MQYYIHHHNHQLGPFTEAEVRAQLASGAISLEDNVWWEGQQGWVLLSQTALAAPVAPPAPLFPSAPVVRGTAAAAAYPAGGAVRKTSPIAIWALVCGCLSLLCGLFASIPAIILGHMGMTATKQDPTLQGRGMALAGMILGYIFTFLIVIYLVCFFLLFGSMTKAGFLDNFNAQLKGSEMTNSSDQPFRRQTLINRPTARQAPIPPRASNQLTRASSRLACGRRPWP